MNEPSVDNLLRVSLCIMSCRAYKTALKNCNLHILLCLIEFYINFHIEDRQLFQNACRTKVSNKATLPLLNNGHFNNLHSRYNNRIL